MDHSTCSKNYKLFAQENSGDLKKTFFYLLLVVALFIACFFHIHISAEGFYSFSADESSRTLDAYRWSINSDKTSTTWLPFYRIFVGTALSIWPDLFLIPRIISFIFGILTLCALGWLAFGIFHNRRLTVLVVLLGAVFSQRVVLSIVPLSEIMFIFFVVTGCGFLARWLFSEKNGFLIAGAVFFALSSSIRYEGWVFSACLAVYLVWVLYKKDINITSRVVIFIGLILLSFPLYWILSHTLQTGNPLGFFASTADRYTFLQGESFLTLLKNSVLFQFFQQNLVSLNLFGLISIVYLATTSNRIRKWVFVPLLSLLVMSGLSILGKGMPSHNFWRIASVWSLLMLPFTAHWILQQGKLFNTKRNFLKSGLTVFIVLMFLVMFATQTMWKTRKSDFTVFDLKTGEFLNKKLTVYSDKSLPRVLIDTSNYSYLHVMIASQHPDVFIFNSGKDPFKRRAAVLSLKQKLSDSTFRNQNIRFLIFGDRGCKIHLLSIPGISKLADFGYWSVYEFISDRSEIDQ